MHKDTLEAFTQELLDYELGKSTLTPEQLAIAQEFWVRGVRRTAPVDMVLFCPSCGVQHIDAPDKPQKDFAYVADSGGHRTPLPITPGVVPPWTNPPHCSHLCNHCGHIWRVADVPTNGVQSLNTIGKDDTLPVIREKTNIARAAADLAEVHRDKRRLVRELDVLLNGEAGAAKQAALCDIVGQVRIDVAELRAHLVNYYPSCMPPHGSVIKWASAAIESELSK